MEKNQPTQTQMAEQNIRQQIEQLQVSMTQLRGQMEYVPNKKDKIKLFISKFIPVSQKTCIDLSDNMIGLSYALMSVQKQLLEMTLYVSKLKVCQCDTKQKTNEKGGVPLYG